MHPTELNCSYMRRAAAEADAFDVDSFEICGPCHTLYGGIDGAILFQAYSSVVQGRDRGAVERHVQKLREIVAIAHGIGRPVFYWHREVTVPTGMIDAVPELRDGRGEFDLLGESYRQLLRDKIAEFFEVVPGMDGIVLTLTEADYSAIHNSDARRYPPAEVVRRIAETFAEELKPRRKRFILRSFGSISQDYEDILAGAAQLARTHEFEIETKITPFDFSPFLPENPYLNVIPGLGLAAECDTLGEFLGAGRLPAANVERIVRDVAFARSRGVTRFAIRIDRGGRNILDSAYGVNALAFSRAIRNPDARTEDIWREWADARWPGVQQRMTDLMRNGLDVVKKSHFVDGHVIFHINPPSPDMKWLKAGGIFSVFMPDVALNNQRYNWGILHNRVAPTREAVLREKDRAVELAEEGLRELQALRAQLTQTEFCRAEELWRNAEIAARLVRELCRCICAYFDDMAALRDDAPTLYRAGVAARGEFGKLLSETELSAIEAQSAGPVRNDVEHGMLRNRKDRIEDTYARPLWALIVVLRAEFRAEFAARGEWLEMPDLVDYVVCGGLTDEWRVEKYMHGSQSLLHNGRPVRIAGNGVFPNGYLQYQLKRSANGGRLLARAVLDKAAQLRVAMDGLSCDAALSPNGTCELLLPASPGKDTVSVRVEKNGASYPWVCGLATLAAPQEEELQL